MHLPVRFSVVFVMILHKLCIDYRVEFSGRQLGPARVDHVFDHEEIVYKLIFTFLF